MKTINVQELNILRNNNEQHTLIDVREQFEYEKANIDGVLVPTSEIVNRYTEIPREGKVIIQCRSGKRSADVISWLEQTHGYENLYNLEGGIIAWANEINPELNIQ